MGGSAYREPAVLLINAIIIILKGNTFPIRNSSITHVTPSNALAYHGKRKHTLYVYLGIFSAQRSSFFALCTKAQRIRATINTLGAYVLWFGSFVRMCFVSSLKSCQLNHQGSKISHSFLFKVIVLLYLSADNMWQGKESYTVQLHLRATREPPSSPERTRSFMND